MFVGNTPQNFSTVLANYKVMYRACVKILLNDSTPTVYSSSSNFENITVCLASSLGKRGAVRHTLAWEQWSKALVCLSQSPEYLRGSALNSHYRHFTSNSPHDLNHTTSTIPQALHQIYSCSNNQTNGGMGTGTGTGDTLSFNMWLTKEDTEICVLFFFFFD